MTVISTYKSLMWVFMIMFLLIHFPAFSQNRIVLKDGKAIQPAVLYSIYKFHIEYEQYGSLHDLEIQKIDYIETDTSRITFDEELNPLYQRVIPGKIPVFRPDANSPSFTGLSFMPLALFQPHNTIMLGAEFPIKQDGMTLLFDAGWITPVGINWDIDKHKNGFILRGELKNYNMFVNTNKFRYMGIQLYYKEVSVSSYGHFWKQESSFQRKVGGANFKYGVTRELRSIYLDYYIGGGLRIGNSHAQSPMPILTAGIRFGLILPEN